jgi:hypothetical protein
MLLHAILNLVQYDVSLVVLSQLVIHHLTCLTLRVEKPIDLRCGGE